MQEDLDLVFGDLDAQLLVSVDMRRAVVIALDVHISVRMQRGIFPVAIFEISDGQWLQGRFLDRLEALASRHTEAACAGP